MTEAPFSLIANEHAVLKFWQQEQIFAKSLAQHAGKTRYTYYDGPPFATGLPHYGHMVQSTIKDMVSRWHAMMGYDVSPRRFGWDCHGIPIEYEIDKQLGMSTDESVAKLGVKGYNDACRGIVQRYSEQWQQVITRLGRWVDFDDDYKTMDPSYMESVWWVFHNLWQQGLIYQGTKVMPYSCALGTALSNFEANSNYQQTQDPSVMVLFPLESQSLSLVIWTTTPWTLPSNMAVAVSPEVAYCRVHDATLDKELVIAVDAVERLSKRHDITIKGEIAASELIGQHYQPLFPYFADLRQQGAFQVLSADFVDASSGTGIVHMAPAFGEDDHRVCADHGIQACPCPLDKHGHFTEEVADFTGVFVKDADKAIIRHLKEKQQIYDQDVLEHSYPFCPRSDTPLIYRTLPSWYVAVTELKERMLAANDEIHWVPAHMQKGRFGQWLSGAKDWAISRHRVWGTPIPLWINDVTGQIHCIGSIEELKQLTGVEVTDLHRDYIDDLTFSRDGEEGVYRRIPEVFDCWFESGSMPYAQCHYPFADKKHFEDGFPADFIAEGVDQTRGWFYVLIVLSTALFAKPAFKNVLVTGIVMAEDGKKMSKRLKNYTDPTELMESHGADALRLYFISSVLVKAEEQRFSNEGVKDMTRRLLLPWVNAVKFCTLYAGIDQWQLGKQQAPTDILDRWILSCLEHTKIRIKEQMAAYDLSSIVPTAITFVDQLTNGYVRLNRERFWAPGLSEDKCQAYTTLTTVLMEFAQLLAPFAPFITEYVFQQLQPLGWHQDVVSVHLCRQSPANNERLSAPLEEATDRMQQIILLGRQIRTDHKIKTKIPLRQLTVYHRDRQLLEGIEQLEPILQRELNVYQIVYDPQDELVVDVHANPVSQRLGRRLGRDFPKVAQQIKSWGRQEIIAFENQGSAQILGHELTAEDIDIRYQSKQPDVVYCNQRIAIALDTTLDDELLLAGRVREIINRIQSSRKAQGFAVTDRITIEYQAEGQNALALSGHSEAIAQETLALAIQVADNLSEPHVHEIEGENLSLVLTLAKPS